MPGVEAAAVIPNRLGLTKTTGADGAMVLVVGAPVVALKIWIEWAKIAKDLIFRAIDRLGDGRGRGAWPAIP